MAALMEFEFFHALDILHLHPPLPLLLLLHHLPLLVFFYVFLIVSFFFKSSSTSWGLHTGAG